MPIFANVARMLCHVLCCHLHAMATSKACRQSVRLQRIIMIFLNVLARAKETQLDRRMSTAMVIFLRVGGHIVVPRSCIMVSGCL